MDWHFEITIPDHRVDQIGKDAAFDEARISAWHTVVTRAQPTKNITLRHVERKTVQPGVFDIYPGYRVRFDFDVDEL